MNKIVSDYILSLHLITGSQHNRQPYLKIINCLLELDAVQFDRQVSALPIISTVPNSEQICICRSQNGDNTFLPNATPSVPKYTAHSCESHKTYVE
jgi:hypothetical protein